MYRSGTYLLDPHFIFDKAHLRSGMNVADFGCGRTGHFTIPMSNRVGKEGRVYAVDILKEVLFSIENRKREHGLENIYTVWADLEKENGVLLPKNSIDVGFLVNILFQSSDVETLLKEIVRLLKPKARLVIVDWINMDNFFSFGKDKEIDFESTINWLGDKGFVLQEDFRAGPKHRGLILFKHD